MDTGARLSSPGVGGILFDQPTVQSVILVEVCSEGGGASERAGRFTNNGALMEFMESIVWPALLLFA